MTEYDKYNREERAICAHLFRLLHESLSKENDSPLGKFLGLINDRIVNVNQTPKSEYHPEFKNIGIYTEVAIIRDHYYTKRSDPYTFLDKLVTLIMQQEDVSGDCKLYSALDKRLNEPWETHPKQIKMKAFQKKIPLTLNETKVYGALQGMFNAKPDLVLTVDNKLIVIEAKFTENFDDEQLKRTKKIAQVWAELLFQEFGFSRIPDYLVVKLGASKFNADITWKDICKIAEGYFPPDDKSRIAFSLGLKLLRDLKYE